jgi:hypothetical protein
MASHAAMGPRTAPKAANAGSRAQSYVFIIIIRLANEPQNDELSLQKLTVATEKGFTSLQSNPTVAYLTIPPIILCALINSKEKKRIQRNRENDLAHRDICLLSVH